jgi:extradiol dioxygenase family protein
MLTIKIDHLALLISSLENSRRFYGEILGLKELERPNFRIKGIWYELGNYQLHLMLHEKFTGPLYHPENETVQPHFSLRVPTEQFHAIVSRLSEKQIQFIEEPKKSPAGQYQAFFYDFDRNMLEIIEDKC